MLSRPSILAAGLLTYLLTVFAIALWIHIFRPRLPTYARVGLWLYVAIPVAILAALFDIESRIR